MDATVEACMLEIVVEQAIREVIEVSLQARDGQLRDDLARLQADAALKGRYGSGAMMHTLAQRAEKELLERAAIALEKLFGTLNRLGVDLSSPLKPCLVSLLEGVLAQEHGRFSSILAAADGLRGRLGSQYPASAAPASYLDGALGSARKLVQAEVSIRCLEADRRAGAKSEADVPIRGAASAGPRDGFINANRPFDAFKVITDVLRSAKHDVLIVDPYMEDSLLTRFADAVPTGVTLRLLASQKANKPAFASAVDAWAAQFGSSRPLQVRLAAHLHDRHIFIDRTAAWVVTQSFNAIAGRSPAEVVRSSPDLVQEKLTAYEGFWASAVPIR